LDDVCRPTTLTLLVTVTFPVVELSVLVVMVVDDKLPVRLTLPESDCIWSTLIILDNFYTFFLHLSLCHLLIFAGIVTTSQ
jgi:hypothetical protein